MPFVTEPTYQRAGYRRWILTADASYLGREDVFAIPAGFDTDLASVPRALEWLIPRDVCMPASLIHDWLCSVARIQSGQHPGHVLRAEYHSPPFRAAHAGANDSPRMTRRDADGIFRRVLREEGIDPVRRTMMWAAVRIGGGMQGADLAEWAKVAAVTVPSVAVLTPFAGPPAVALAGIRAMKWVVSRCR